MAKRTPSRTPKRRATVQATWARASGGAKKRAPKVKWSQDVTEHSDALDLQRGVFEQKSPRKVAQSLKRSAEQSKRRKGTPYQSAMSMLNFFINRAGKQLSAQRRRVLDAAKEQLRVLFGRTREA
jgi:hypothetical protein